jgi:hypothetical protein
VLPIHDPCGLRHILAPIPNVSTRRAESNALLARLENLLTGDPFMKIFLTTSVTLTILASSAFAVAEERADSTQGVSTYKETAVFNHVVGDARFVGNFVAGPGRCDVTVFLTDADNAALTPPLRRFVLPIAAGARSELEVDPTSTLVIACTSDADEIKVAPQ